MEEAIHKIIKAVARDSEVLSETLGTGMTRQGLLAVLGLIPAPPQAHNECTLPKKYLEACRALNDCMEIGTDELWIDRSAALTAWSRIYMDDTAGHLARTLRLRAYRRMCDLSIKEIAPSLHDD